MLDNALGLITAQLNQHLRRRFQLSEDIAVLTNLLAQDGGPVEQSNNKVVLFLAGIKPGDTGHRVSGEEPKDLAPHGALGPAKWDLAVMCAANFSGANYAEGLKLLSSTIQFFQAHPVLSRDNTPSLDPQLDKLLISIEDMSASEINSLWNSHNSGHYLPSVICRVQVFGILSAGHSES